MFGCFGPVKAVARLKGLIQGIRFVGNATQFQILT